MLQIFDLEILLVEITTYWQATYCLYTALCFHLYYYKTDLVDRLLEKSSGVWQDL